MNERLILWLTCLVIILILHFSNKRHRKRAGILAFLTGMLLAKKYDEHIAKIRFCKIFSVKYREIEEVEEMIFKNLSKKKESDT